MPANSDNKEEVTQYYVITCGDEGVQINEGKRLSFVGCGFQLDGFSDVIKVLKRILDKDLRIASNQENDWIKEKLSLLNWEQVNAMSQQHIAALADKEKLLYVGYLPFKDPAKLKYDIKGHMVRPHNVHIANKICFTLAGGEKTYNLGNYQISAEWVSYVPKKLAETVIKAQVEFYKKLSGITLKFVVEEEGELGPKVAAKNKKVLEKMGFKIEETIKK